MNIQIWSGRQTTIPQLHIMLLGPINQQVCSNASARLSEFGEGSRFTSLSKLRITNEIGI